MNAQQGHVQEVMGPLVLWSSQQPDFITWVMSLKDTLNLLEPLWIMAGPLLPFSILFKCHCVEGPVGEKEPLCLHWFQSVWSGRIDAREIAIMTDSITSG